MNKLLKCWYCGEKDREDKIEVVNGTQKKRYHTLNCYNLYVKDQAFKQKEKEELDELVEVIKKIHGIETIPHQFYSYLQDIRNGNELFGRVGQRKHKKGYSYSTISATYQECSDSINWARSNRDFKGTLTFLKYTMAIIRDKIGIIDERLKYEKQQQEQKLETDQTYDYSLNEFNHKEKDDELDISDML